MDRVTVPGFADLSERLGWRAPVFVDDGAGGRTISSYAAALERWAHVSAVPGLERMAAGSPAPAQSVRIVMRASADPGIRSSWRGEWRSQVLEVGAVSYATPAPGWVSVEAVIVGDLG